MKNLISSFDLYSIVFLIFVLFGIIIGIVLVCAIGGFVLLFLLYGMNIFTELVFHTQFNFQDSLCLFLFLSFVLLFFKTNFKH